MKKILIALLLLVSAPSFAQYTLQHMKPLTELKGSWESERKKGTLVEQWIIENDSTFAGYSYIRSATDSLPQEKVQLKLRQGKILYMPSTAKHGNGKNVPETLYEVPVTFTLSGIENGKYIFENRAHDFPQQITYQLIDKNTLHAAIAGPMNGKDVHIDFHFKRSSSK